MADKYQLLKRYWHYSAFRPCQEEIIDSVLQGRDILALLPTGGGKSLCYQLPTLMMEGLCLVVSPLIALMKDQVQQLNDRHLPAACLYAGLGAEDTSKVLNNAVSGQLKFLYVSPERLRNRAFIEHFRRMKVCLIAIDEAHCISQWGYDLRPPYRQIAEIRDYHPAVPVLALTATATPEVADDVCVQLRMRDCRMFRSSFVRQNLVYTVAHTGDKFARLMHLCNSIDSGSGIVYCGSRRRTEAIASQLCANGIDADYYHAGLTSVERDKRQAAWMDNKKRVMVATNAFGMGIDKPDVRFVAHVDVPCSLEAYFQEAGRAGRDGLQAQAVLIYDEGDRRRLADGLELDYPPISHIRNTYRALCNFYRIPMGSGADSRYDFKLNEICSMYDLNVREFYSCCRFLERAGLISLPDRDEAYSHLRIIVGRDELYRFQVNHMRMGDMLQTIIRMYPGLFTGLEPVDEGKIAKRCFTESDDVVKLLTKLHAMKIVEYRQRPRVPQIVFCSERINENTIFFSEQDYSLLKEAARKRVAAMLHYLEDDSLCRSRQLVAYFGETSTEDCGRCDVCLKGQSNEKDVEAAVLHTVALGPISVHGLCELLAQQNYIGVEEAVRELLDRGELQLDRNLFLSIS